MAASPIRVKMEGVAELKAALEELGDVTATKVGVRANREAAAELRMNLAAVAPYDSTKDNKKYGHLRDAIRVRKVKSRTANTIVHIVSTGVAFWGSMQEFGTVKMAARPWWRPLVDANYERIFKLQTDKLGAGIEREAKRIANKNRIR